MALMAQGAMYLRQLLNRIAICVIHLFDIDVHSILIIDNITNTAKTLILSPRGHGALWR